MDIFSELKIGDKIDIDPRGNLGKNIGSLVYSQIVDLGEDVIYIANTIKGGLVYPLEIGQKVTVIFYRDEKGIHSFLGEIVEKIQQDNIIYALRQVSAVKKIQRRDYYRLPIVRKVLVRDGHLNENVHCVTKNISGGGLKAISKKGFDVGKKVEMTIYLEDEDCVVVSGEIIRSIPIIDPSKSEYELGVKFGDIDERIRNKIVSFIFKQQRLLRKRGLV